MSKDMNQRQRLQNYYLIVAIFYEDRGEYDLASKYYAKAYFLPREYGADYD